MLWPQDPFSEAFLGVRRELGGTSPVPPSPVTVEAPQEAWALLPPPPPQVLGPEPRQWGQRASGGLSILLGRARTLWLVLPGPEGDLSEAAQGWDGHEADRVLSWEPVCAGSRVCGRQGPAICPEAQPELLGEAPSQVPAPGLSWRVNIVTFHPSCSLECGRYLVPAVCRALCSA